MSRPTCIDCGKVINYYAKRCQPCDYKVRGERQKGKNNPFWKGGARKCVDCGKEIMYESTRCWRCAGALRRGKKCHLWKGGIAESPYPREFSDSLREQIRFRDGYKCRECGTPQVECLTKLSVHHIDYNKNNNIHSNLVSLCQHCHTATSHKRDKWIEHFQEVNI